MAIISVFLGPGASSPQQANLKFLSGIERQIQHRFVLKNQEPFSLEGHFC